MIMDRSETVDLILKYYEGCCNYDEKLKMSIELMSMTDKEVDDLGYVISSKINSGYMPDGYVDKLAELQF